MSSVSTESQYGLRHINGVPVWNGDILTLRDYETAALWFRAGLKPGEQERAVARLWANLQRPAKEVVSNVQTSRLKMHEELSVSFVSCEKALPHRRLCLTPTRKYRRMIKLDEDQEKSSETMS